LRPGAAQKRVPREPFIALRIRVAASKSTARAARRVATSSIVISPLSELIAIGRVVWSGFSGCWRWLGAETTISHDAALSNVRHCLNKYALNAPQIVSLQYELISVPLTNMVPEHLPSDGRLEL
jgi:hypothetical protein